MEALVGVGYLWAWLIKFLFKAGSTQANLRWYKIVLVYQIMLVEICSVLFWGEPSGAVCTATAQASSGGESGV